MINFLLDNLICLPIFATRLATDIRRGVRVIECAWFEIRCTVTGTGGLNPSLSAFARRSELRRMKSAELAKESFARWKGLQRMKSVSRRCKRDWPLIAERIIIKSPTKCNIVLGFFILPKNQSFAMWYYVYILELNNGKHYVGCTVNVKERFTRHTKDYVPGNKTSLANEADVVLLFPDRYKAYDFERYLKSGSGRAFAVKHLF